MKLPHLIVDYGEGKVLAAISRLTGTELSVHQIQAQLIPVTLPARVSIPNDIPVPKPQFSKYVTAC